MSSSATHALQPDPAPDAPAPGPRPAAPVATKPAAAKPAAAASGATRARPVGDVIAIVIACMVPLAITAWGWRYYVESLGERLRDPLHSLLKPSGPVGLGLGILGFSLFVFMWLYPFRKAVRWLAWTGPLGAWMRVHIVAGLSIPLIVAVHAGWRFEGLIGLGYLSMFVVSLSGIVGRYLYVHIPRSRNGLELTMEEVGGERRALITQIAAASGLVPVEVERRLAVDTRSYAGLDPLRTIGRMVQDDLARSRTLRELEHELARPRAGAVALAGSELKATLRLARRELALSQQVRMLEATRRVFGYWHVAHRPFAITALIAVFIHVVVAVVVGGVSLPWGR